MEEGDSFSHRINGIKNPKEASVSEEEASKEERSSTKWRKIFVLACLTYNNFWAAACYSLQAPFFPKEAELKGATPTEYGLVFAVFELVMIVTSPIYGKLIATVSPKFLLTAGIFLEGGACVLFGILDQIPPGNTYIGMAFAVRIVEGIGGAAFVTASFSVVAAEFPNAVGKTFSLVETAFGFGLIVGPTVGGALYEAGGFMLPFAVTGGLQLLGTILLCILMPTVDTPHLPQATNVKKFLLNWGVVIYSLSIATCLLFIGFNAATLEPHLRRFNLTPAVLGATFIITGGVYAFTTPIWGWIVDRGQLEKGVVFRSSHGGGTIDEMKFWSDGFVYWVNPFGMIVLGYILTSTGILFIGPAPFFPFDATVWSVVISLLSIGLGMSAKLVAAFSGALKSTLARGFPDNMATYGMVSALFSSSCSVGAFIGPSLGGLLLDTTGYELGTMVLFTGEAAMMTFVIIYMFWEKLKKASDTSENTALLGKRTSEERSCTYSGV